MHAGKLRVQRHCFCQFVTGGGEICGFYFRRTEHQVRFCRVAIPQDAIDQYLSLFNLVVANQGRS